MSSSFARVLFASFVVLIAFQSVASSVDAESTTGLSKRKPWTTSRIVGSPEPPLPFTTEQIFTNLKFNRCLDIVKMPGSNRLFVVEQSGKIYSFENRPDVAEANLAMDFAKEIPGVRETYAIAFHPRFSENRYCYVCYIKAANQPDGTHIARFRVTDSSPPTLDLASETTILTWLSGGHNGCSLQFGPDGFLYISTGDGSGPNPPDILKSGQDISELLASILRIDVEHTEPGKNYRIPSDNPFVQRPGARGEIWSYGLRNPWRMSFDAKTGDLWVGDVGWELWESLIRVDRGGNYGWSVMEARQPTNPEWTRGPTPILTPTIAHPHSESSSITDGLTYYGTRLKALYGHHIYGDYDTGKIWSFRFENGTITEHREIADTTHRIVGFGTDQDDELILLDHIAGTLHRLSPNAAARRESAFPTRLSQSGLFEPITTHSLHAAEGVIPFAINSELWSDHATAERWIAIPQDGSIQTKAAAWTFPADSVLAKTLSIEMVQGDKNSVKRIETQLLHFDGVDWQPYTYQWNTEQTDATLVPASGADMTLKVAAPDAPSGLRIQNWRFSGRAECQRCHQRWTGFAVAFNAHQLNRAHTIQSVSANQLDAFVDLGLFENPIAEKERANLVNPCDTTLDLESRARSYLHVNCAHCHRLHAGSAVLSKMPFDLPLEKTDMLSVRPTQGTFAVETAEVIAPGDPFRSILFYRMAKLGGGRMPHLGSNEIDVAGLGLIEEWISRMQPADTDEAKRAAIQRKRESEALKQWIQSSDPNDQKSLVDSLLSTSTGAIQLCRAIDKREIPVNKVSMVVQRATQHANVSTRELFERFLPAENRVKRLGDHIHPDQILSLPGDVSQGQRIFFETAGVSCKNCHQINKTGIELGPDLSLVGKKYTPEQILENILQPSKSIDPKYQTVLIETGDGEVVSGILVSKDENAVVVKDALNKETRIPKSRVENVISQRMSIMPDSLVREMTAQQVADLLAYLSSLK
ncbi:MAG: PQQ-dependent sugar dehydrogenase [Pirellula sp.]